MPERLGAVIVAAGSGVRMDGIDKLYTRVAGKGILERAIEPFERSALVEKTVLVVSDENLERARETVEHGGFGKVAAICAGGEERQDSVRNGLEALGECDYVAVHDGCRPLVTVELIERGMAVARESGAAVPGLPLAETVKEADEDGNVVRTVDRSRLYTIQTPQVFRRDLLLRAHEEVDEGVTDDAGMLEAIGVPVAIFPGVRSNVKITTAEDIDLVEALLTASESAVSG
jgi:2-C-methyl-D-erythritol 4-phosphate cytidylyltransferase